MRSLAFVTFAVLAVIAGLHAYWGFGGLWPAKTVRGLIDTVIGAPDMQRMPSVLLTCIVAGLIFAAGLFALAAQGILYAGPRWFVRIALGVIAFVFIGRGAAGYLLPAGIGQSEPFATLDRLYYSPLCLALGAAFAALLIASLTEAAHDT